MEELQNEEIIEQYVEEDKRWCVYIHTNRHNNKVYIGITNDIKTRWGNNGKKYLATRSDGSYEHPVFAKALKKYNDWDVDWEHIIFMEDLTQTEAKHIEELLIALYKSNCRRYKNPEYGYNLTDGGDGLNGYRHTEDAKKKVGEKNKAKWLDMEYRNNQVKKHKRENLSEDTILKMSETKKALYVSPENNPFYGRTHTEDTKDRLRKYASNRPPEVNLKISESKKGKSPYNKGKSMSDEAKQHMRDGNKFKIPIIQLEKNGQFVSKYESFADGSRATGIDRSAIARCYHEQQHSAGGFLWVSEEKYELQLKK